MPADDPTSLAPPSEEHPRVAAARRPRAGVLEILAETGASPRDGRPFKRYTVFRRDRAALRALLVSLGTVLATLALVVILIPPGYQTAARLASTPADLQALRRVMERPESAATPQDFAAVDLRLLERTAALNAAAPDFLIQLVRALNQALESILAMQHEEAALHRLDAEIAAALALAARALEQVYQQRAEQGIAREGGAMDEAMRALARVGAVSHDSMQRHHAVVAEIGLALQRIAESTLVGDTRIALGQSPGEYLAHLQVLHALFAEVQRAVRADAGNPEKASATLARLASAYANTHATMEYQASHEALFRIVRDAALASTFYCEGWYPEDDGGLASGLPNLRGNWEPAFFGMVDARDLEWAGSSGAEHAAERLLQRYGLLFPSSEDWRTRNPQGSYSVHDYAAILVDAYDQLAVRYQTLAQPGWFPRSNPFDVTWWGENAWENKRMSTGSRLREVCNGE